VAVRTPVRNNEFLAPGAGLTSPQLLREYLTALLSGQDREYFVLDTTTMSLTAIRILY